jgi:hypothetical protein
MSPDEVVKALVAGNFISPPGTVRIGEEMPIVPINSLARQAKDLEAIPIRPGQEPSVYIRDVGIVLDTTDIPSGYALANGRRAVYILVTKRADASTLPERVRAAPLRRPRWSVPLRDRGATAVLSKERARPPQITSHHVTALWRMDLRQRIRARNYVTLVTALWRLDLRQVTPPEPAARAHPGDRSPARGAPLGHALRGT